MKLDCGFLPYRLERPLLDFRYLVNPNVCWSKMGKYTGEVYSVIRLDLNILRMGFYFDIIWNERVLPIYEIKQLKKDKQLYTNYGEDI